MKLGEKEREDTYRNRVFHGFLLIADELALKLNDLQDESISLKKKHTANTKDLTNQLQKLHKQLENQSKVKHFGMLKHYEDSKRYLSENPGLVCEDTANYLVVWCIDLEIEEVII